MLALIVGTNFYVFFRLWHLIPTSIIRIVVVTLGITLSLSLFVGIFANSVLPNSVATIIHRGGTSWLFILLYLLIIFLLADIVRATHLLSINKYLFSSWVGVTVIFVLITIVMSYGFINYTNKRRIELNIEIAKDFSSPIKIVAISDLHLGYAIGKNEFEKWVELINKENADILLIAGDVIDNSIKPLLSQNMAEVFKKVKTKYGIYASLGNHEYISGLENSLAFLKNADITVLRDSIAIMNNNLYIVGRDDKTNPNRQNINKLIENIDRSKPVILLDHQPYNLSEAENNNIDFQFSGHTHKGQLIPISWITNLLFEKPHGYLKKGNTNIYVTSGLGIWGGKFRIGTQSEYVVINLKSSYCKK
jgi:predicted MPP superfamily phosphohydrolase